MHFDLDELPDGARAGPMAQRGAAAASHTPTETLIDCVLAGDEMHYALASLAWRGMSEDELRALMERSTAKMERPDDWRARFDDIPRLVASAREKAARQAAEAFGDTRSAPVVGLPAVMPSAVDLPLLRPADMARLALVARKWIVADLIPASEPTLVYGAGATGKSLLLLQLAICIASGRKWLERETPTGRALFYTCEDSTDEINRRATSILKALGIGWEDCGDRLAIIPMRNTDADAALAIARNDGTLLATPTYDALRRAVVAFKPDIVVVDTLADSFAGDENARSQAKQFVKMVTRLYDATYLVTAHPSVSGMADGRGASGSTGWPAAVRSHLFFERVKDGETREPDSDVRRLRNLKANYSRQGAGEIEVRWVEGAFVALDGGVAASAFAQEDVDALFIRLLEACKTQGRFVNSASGATYAPAVFAASPEAKAHRLAKPDFRWAMERLLAAGRITNATRMVDRKERTYLAVVEGEPIGAPWLAES